MLHEEFAAHGTTKCPSSGLCISCALQWHLKSTNCKNENLRRIQVFSLAGKMLHEEFATHCTTKCPSSGLCILCALQLNFKSTNCKNENLKRIQVFSLSGKMLHEEFAAHCTTKCPLSEQHWATEWPLHLVTIYLCSSIEKWNLNILVKKPCAFSSNTSNSD